MNIEVWAVRKQTTVSIYKGQFLTAWKLFPLLCCICFWGCWGRFITLHRRINSFKVTVQVAQSIDVLSPADQRRCRRKDFLFFQWVKHLNIKSQGKKLRNYIPVSSKTLKDLKQAFAQYQPAVPLPLSLLDSISGKAFLPSDWRVLKTTHLTWGEYLPWKTNYLKRCQDQAIRNQ